MLVIPKYALRVPCKWGDANEIMGNSSAVKKPAGLFPTTLIEGSRNTRN